MPADLFQTQISGFASVKIYLCYLSLEKTADIFRRRWFPRKMTSDEQAQKFHGDDGVTALIKVVLPIGRGKFPRDTTNHSHYTGLGSDTSSSMEFLRLSMGGYQDHNSVFLFCCAILLFCYDVLSFCFNILSLCCFGLMCSYAMLLCYCVVFFLSFCHSVLIFHRSVVLA